MMARARAAAAAGAGFGRGGEESAEGEVVGARHADPGLLVQAAGLGLPLVAIGGITPDNGAIPVAAGADLLAVVGAVFDAPDPVAAARALAALF